MACIAMPIAMVTYEVEVASDNVYTDTQCNPGIDMRSQYVAQYRSTLEAQTLLHMCLMLVSVCLCSYREQSQYRLQKSDS